MNVSNRFSVNINQDKTKGTYKAQKLIPNPRKQIDQREKNGKSHGIFYSPQLV